MMVMMMIMMVVMMVMVMMVMMMMMSSNQGTLYKGACRCECMGPELQCTTVDFMNIFGLCCL